MAEKKAAAGRAVEVDGIRLTVLPDLDDDYELAECSYTATDPSATVEERTRARMRMYRVILGEDFQRVMDELRTRNGGKLHGTVVIDFVTRVIKASRAAKN